MVGLTWDGCACGNSHLSTALPYSQGHWYCSEKTKQNTQTNKQQPKNKQTNNEANTRNQDWYIGVFLIPTSLGPTVLYLTLIAVFCLWKFSHL